MAEATILIVDDNPVNLSVLRALLGREDYDLIATDSGESALDLAKCNPTFDLIMLDVSMPGINGIEVCRQLKTEPITKHLPILLISAFRTDEASIREGLEAGADGYITQPVEDIALRAWVRATLRISRLEKQLAECAPKKDADPDAVFQRFAKLSHAVNNPLQALCAAADLLALELDENSGGQELLREILRNAEEAAKLVAEASMAAKTQLPEA